MVSGKYKGNDKFFTLATYGGKFFAVSEACGRCKFPMVRVRPPSSSAPAELLHFRTVRNISRVAMNRGCYEQGLL